MRDDDEEVDDTCPRCAGTGEGVSGWGKCSMCHGRGYLEWVRSGDDDLRDTNDEDY